jgi:hypothetical protein
MFSSVDGGRSRILHQHPPWGGRRRYFLALMVGAPGSSAPSPLRGAPSTFLALMVATPGSLAPSPPRGAHRRWFLAFMVDTLGSPAPVPPRGPPSMFVSVNGGCSQISSSDTLQGGSLSMFSSGLLSMFFSIEKGKVEKLD